MKTAQVLDDKIGIIEVPDVTLDGRKGAVVKVLGCGLCGTDIIKFDHKTVPQGTVLGHEIVAQVLEIDSDTDFKSGDVIVTTHHIPCGKCDYCKNGNVSMCRHFKETNIFPGGFSERVFLSEEHLQNVAYLKPENLTVEEASFYEPLSCCVRAVRRAKLLPESEVLVLGLGSIGILMSQALKADGMKVLGCDLLEKRVETLKNLGIDAVTRIPENFRPNAVFLTAGADKTVEIAIKTVRDGGKIIVFSSTPNSFPFDNNDIYYRELTVMGSYSPDLCDMRQSLHLLKSGRVKVSGLSTVYPLEELEQAMKDTKNAKIMKAFIKV
ncbi:MAG: alcohol dehydrogenase catalytic domain-containing protein [Fusobacterium sp.]|nr:alcohol dehydrogenase catalytic domain-containing protein [Fusobacterium sp.]